VRSRTFSFSSGNIETRTLHLAVAYAFDRGSLLLPRAGTLLRLTALTPLTRLLLRSIEVVPPSRNRRLKQHSYFIGRGSVGERPSTSTPALGTADKRTCTFPLLPFGWIVTVRRHALFRHLRRHRTRARMLFDITDELKKLEAHRSPALLRL
jgi:hypothetical protein